jgi:hypothetical protein
MMLQASLKDTAGPIVSMFAAAISILFFVLSFRLSKRMANRALNLEAHKMLIDIDRQLIADPRLWAFYDDHPVSKDQELNESSLQFRAKLEAFAYLQLNMFEIILLEIPEPAEGMDRNHSNVWCDFFFDTISRSSLARSILDRPNSGKIYNIVLLALYDQWKSSAGAASDHLAPED